MLAAMETWTPEKWASAYWDREVEHEKGLALCEADRDREWARLDAYAVESAALREKLDRPRRRWGLPRRR